MQLSIGICSLPIRINSFSKLINNLNSQIITHGFQQKVEIISIMDSKGMSVGQKRNHIKNLARGQYLCFIDDDDRISNDYLPSIMQALQTGADVITFRGEYHDGAMRTDWTISLDKGNIDTHGMLYRLPNHLTPVRKDIYSRCNFPPINYGEDSSYATEIHKLIKTEFHIPKKLYFYDFHVNKSQTHPKSTTGAFKH